MGACTTGHIYIGMQYNVAFISRVRCCLVHVLFLRLLVLLLTHYLDALCATVTELLKCDLEKVLKSPEQIPLSLRMKWAKDAATG
jgi:hypothetical protein